LNVWQKITKLSLFMLPENKKRTHNSRFAKAGVFPFRSLRDRLCFYESELLNSSFVHLMKFSVDNPRLRKAAKRYRAF
jgi:hypothetical protein